MIYSTSPILFPVTARLTSMGARTLGSFIVLSYFIVLAIALFYQAYYLYILCIAIGFLIILASQFALQVFFFFSLGTSIFCASLHPIMLFVITISLAFLIPQLGLKDILKFKINHYKWYIRNMKTIRQVAGRNRFSDIVNILSYLKHDKRKFVLLITHYNTILILIYSVPIFFVFSVILVKYNIATSKLLWDANIFQFSMAIIISSLFAFMLTSLRPFLWLGQAERYFEYSLPFLAIVSVYTFLQLSLDYESITFSLFIIQTVIIFMTLLFKKADLLSCNMELAEHGNFKQLLDYFEPLKGVKVLTLPPKLSFKISALSNNHDIKYYYRFINQPQRGFRYIEEDSVEFEVIKPDLDSIIQKYNINTIVTDNDYLETVQKRGIHYTLERYKLGFKNKEYTVYTVNS
ncbi:MAG: hypothetical protein GY721_12155 [Deltaproteobacteria bacterium]|nr:hypothetical protein [Deltaproteobacteria bacterium]